MTSAALNRPSRRAFFFLFLLSGLLFGFSFGCGGSGDSATEGAESSAETAPAEGEAIELMSDNPTENDAPDIEPAGPVVSMNTTLGEIRIELFPDQAPETVANFIRYVEDGHYDGTIFHRVVRGFVIQGGGFTADMEEKSTREPIPNEANNGLPNRRGTLAMARTRDPHSASAQFFVNTKDNPVLDHTSESMRGWGYAVFGRVIAGMDTVDRIESSPVVARAGHNDVPDTPVVVESARVDR